MDLIELDIWAMLLTLLLPALGAVALLFVSDHQVGAIRGIALGATASVCLPVIVVTASFLHAFGPEGTPPENLTIRAAALPAGTAGTGFLVLRAPWIKTDTFRIEWFFGLDGINLPFVQLTVFVCLLAMIASISIRRHLRAYCVLFLVLETGLIGAFMALDLFLFYVFFEMILLPTFFLIGVWGGPRRQYAALKFLIYTLAGSLLILLAMLAIFFRAGEGTFDMLRLAELARPGENQVFSASFQSWIFVLLFTGFAIKLPAIPVHTWLPDAHVEAPTPMSMILAGVVLKVGGYGLLRIALPICPLGALAWSMPVAVIAIVTILYGAIAALGQTDLKRVVAYSSISHMGYVKLGIISLPLLDPAVLCWGLVGAVMQLVAHGISAAGLFFLVGVQYERTHIRDLNRLGGLMKVMPRYGAVAIVLFFTSLGLPGLAGFLGELLPVLAAFQYDPWIGCLAALGAILTAGYILWTVQRLLYGENPAFQGLPDLTWRREMLVAAPLVAVAILLGLFPNLLLSWMTPDVNHLAETLVSACQSSPADSFNLARR